MAEVREGSCGGRMGVIKVPLGRGPGCAAARCSPGPLRDKAEVVLESINSGRYL